MRSHALRAVAAALVLLALAGCGEKKTELGQGGSVVTGSAGPQGAQNAAKELVRCMRYPPDGLRGMAATRASGWGRNAGYAKEANREVCLLVQVETQEGVRNVDAIAGADQRSPRTNTAGTPSSAWPISSEAAAAISSAKPVSLTRNARP